MTHPLFAVFSPAGGKWPAAEFPQKIEPSQVPSVWYKHAKFNHASHRAMDCRSCHEQAYASTTHTDVLLPQIDNCKQCHGPARKEGGKQVAGVRHDCTECHSYHHGAAPLQGLGAAARDPKTPLSVGDFLRGGKK